MQTQRRRDMTRGHQYRAICFLTEPRTLIIGDTVSLIALRTVNESREGRT